MTNEELVREIQAGDETLYTVLWEQVERFVAQQANRTARTLTDRPAADYDDLYQSGYEAMRKAVESFEPARDKSFIGWFAFYLKRAFAEAADYRKASPRTMSLDAPIQGTEDLTLADTIPDPTDHYEDAEQTIWQEQLRSELEQAMDTLPEVERETICRRFWQGETLKEISEREGVTATRIRQREWSALCKLRHPRHRKRLEQFLGERVGYYRHVGLERFQTTGISAVEELVLMRERMEAEKGEGGYVCEPCTAQRFECGSQDSHPRPQNRGGGTAKGDSDSESS